MRVLIYSTCSYLDPQFGVMLECALQHKKQGNEVLFAYCAGAAKICMQNIQGSKILCKFCQYYQKTMLKKNIPGIQTLPQNKVCRKKEHSFSSVKDLRATVYRDCTIGYGVLSTYISVTRDCNPDLQEPAVRLFIEQMLDEAAYVADMAWDLVERERPERIIVFNGRLMENRPFREIAKIKHIPFESYEVIGNFRAEDKDFKVISYPDALPHDISVNTAMLKKLWETSPESDEVKLQKGEDFYIRRRGGVIAGDRVYISGQKQGLLPENWDYTKKNIVIFNSSEDEFAAIGPEFDQFALFPSQLDGIQYMLEHVRNPEYHFYLRIHPNLTNVHFEYREKLLALEEIYPNITVIDAPSPISTYALMDVADKIIVFGSTAGAESVFWEKPVILLAASFYRDLDITYNPKTPEQLIDLLVQKLPCKEKINAVKFGYYLLNRIFLAKSAEFIDLRIKQIKIWRYTFFTTGYATLFGSCALMKFLRLILVYSFRKFGIFKLPVPYFDDHIMKKS